MNQSAGQQQSARSGRGRGLAGMALLAGWLLQPMAALAQPDCAVPMFALSQQELAELDLAVLQCLASEGFPRAQLELGKRYSDGRGAPQDHAKAAHWLARAAGLVPPDASVPEIVFTPDGTVTAMFRPDALKGPASAEARYRLGRLYLEGKGVRRRPEYGRKLMETAVKQGLSHRP